MPATTPSANQIAQWLLTATYDPARVRAVYLLRQDDLDAGNALCDACIADTVRPLQAIDDIVLRDDELHCVGCDYHADPLCGVGGHWCAASSGEDAD